MRQRIQKEMLKPISKYDEAGYIYCYILQQGPKASTNSHCYFKIGRAKNPIKRMIQVAHQCHYIPSLLDILPS
ncbi:hypothetical protein BJ944DRAFT_164773, partial [Cunninghamella echinulata]